MSKTQCTRIRFWPLQNKKVAKLNITKKHSVAKFSFLGICALLEKKLRTYIVVVLGIRFILRHYSCSCARLLCPLPISCRRLLEIPDCCSMCLIIIYKSEIDLSWLKKDNSSFIIGEFNSVIQLQGNLFLSFLS